MGFAFFQVRHKQKYIVEPPEYPLFIIFLNYSKPEIDNFLYVDLSIGNCISKVCYGYLILEYFIELILIP